MTIRKATSADIELLIRLRLDFIEQDSGEIAELLKQKLAMQLRRYFAKSFADGNFVAILAEESGSIVSTAYLAVSEKPPWTRCPNGKTGTIMNVLTHAAHRRKGIATKVLSRLIDEAKALNISSLDLLATEAGLSLYKTLGFSTVDYAPMKLELFQAPPRSS